MKKIRENFKKKYEIIGFILLHWHYALMTEACATGSQCTSL